MTKTYVIILAAGSGSRMNSAVNKVLMSVCGKTVIRRSAEAFSSFADELIVVTREQDRTAIVSDLNDCSSFPPIRFVTGGKTRQESVLNALRSLSCDPDDIILIHDGARCLVDGELIRRVIHSALEFGTGIPGIPATSTYKVSDDNSFVSYTPDRSYLYEIQTPQGFKSDIIIPFSVKASEDRIECTDDAGILEYYHVPVRIVDGSSTNIKLTEHNDLSRAKSILEGSDSSVRIGMGYDVHRLSSERKLILCGVEIPYDMGLLGHSDADVALHALMDAMLGACALGDIGKHFPDTDKKYKDVSSLQLLKKTVTILSDAGYRVFNADITIVAQKPKLLPYIPDMIHQVASVLGISSDCVSIKATTTEKLGFEGRMEGISSYAVCTVVEL